MLLRRRVDKSTIDQERIIDKGDWLYAAEKLLYIRAKEGEIIPFTPWTEQRQYYKNHTYRDLDVKGRQIGNTTIKLIEGLFNAITTPGYEFRIVFDKVRSAREALENLKLMFNSLDDWFRPEVDLDNTNEIRFPRLNSGIRVLPCGRSAAQADATGRGGMINFGLLSEYDFYPYQDKTYNAFSDTVPQPRQGGKISIESTPNGRRDLHKRVQQCLGGMSPYKLHFYPWYIHEEYHIPQTWEGLSTLTDAEAELVDKYNLTPAQLAWRRWKIADKGGDAQAVRDFQREYPTDLASCFQVAEGGYFDADSLSIYRNLIQDRLPGFEWGVNVFQKPLPGSKYVISGDTAGGGAEGHFCSGDILNRDNWEQVAHIYGKWRPDVFGDILAKYGKEYNEALIIVENVGIGAATSLHLETAGYPNLYYHVSKVSGQHISLDMVGYPTNSEKAKQVLVTDLESAIRKRRVIIRSQITLDTLWNIVWDDLGKKATAQPGCPDDAMISLALGIQALQIPEFQRQTWNIY